MRCGGPNAERRWVLRLAGVVLGRRSRRVLQVERICAQFTVSRVPLTCACSLATVPARIICGRVMLPHVLAGADEVGARCLAGGCQASCAAMDARG